MKVLQIFAFLFFCHFAGYGQANKLTGRFQDLSNANVSMLRLEGISFNLEKVLSTKADAFGNFQFPLDLANDEVVVLYCDKFQTYTPLMLAKGENVEIRGNDIQNFQSFDITSGTLTKQHFELLKKRNLILSRGSALAQTQRLYDFGSLQSLWLRTEMEEQHKNLLQSDEEIAASKNKLLQSYFFVDEKLKEQGRAVVSNEVLNKFLKIDFADANLYRTGLVRQVLDQQLALLKTYEEKFGYEARNTKTKEDIDHILSGLAKVEERHSSSIIKYLMENFEKNSQKEMLSYLSEKVLESSSCSVNKDVEVKAKQVTMIQEGKTMADIIFTNANTGAKKLSDIKAEKTVLLFWSSECSHCEEELPKFKKMYASLKEKGIEMVGISMDTNPESYQKAIKDLPWINACDFKSIDSDMVKNYYITGTPSLFLIDKNLKLLYKNQVNVADALAALL